LNTCPITQGPVPFFFKLVRLSTRQTILCVVNGVYLVTEAGDCGLLFYQIWTCAVFTCRAC